MCTLFELEADSIEEVIFNLALFLILPFECGDKLNNMAY